MRGFLRFITPLFLMVFLALSCGKKGPPVLKDLPEEKKPANPSSKHQPLSVDSEKPLHCALVSISTIIRGLVENSQ